MESSLNFVLLIVVISLLSKGWRRDDTDAPKRRSGMTLYTDHGTGVQYVGTLFGGITPRLDKNGNVVTVTSSPPRSAGE